MNDAREAVLISGASSGIGEAAAHALAQRGFRVFAGVRSPQDAARLRGGDTIVPVTLDVSRAETIAAAVATVEASGTPLRAVVSNAGIALGGPFEHLPMDALRRQFEVNVFGALGLVQAALPLLPRTRGRVVFVGSISGRLALPYLGAYSASKFALRAIAGAMRLELAPVGIVVSLIEPGSVKTPIWKKGREGHAAIEAMLERSPREHYRVAMERVLEATHAEERIGMDAQRVADAIVHAIVADRPRASYLLGGPAKIGSLLAILPSAWRERAIRASMRLP